VLEHPRTALEHQFGFDEIYGSLQVRSITIEVQSIAQVPCEKRLNRLSVVLSCANEELSSAGTSAIKRK
jgi:hypothetical protein